jgi:hypothetical protein
MRVCLKCGNKKKDTDFAWKSKTKGTRQSRCRACKRTYNEFWYEANKTQQKSAVKERNTSLRIEASRLREEAKNKPCHDCKGVFPSYIMEFDHRDPTTKTSCVSEIAAHSLKALEMIRAEIQKCDVVCANCHKIRTHFRK